ncbi:MAG TPA: HNH endonuclease [Puia sp.]|nr:HNH endonuclease [Puia sp.]
MEYKLNDFHYNVPEQDLINDLKKVALKLGTTVLTSREYDEAGKYNSGTIHRRFKSWNKALEKAGLEPALSLNIPDKELFENVESVWISLGRQPTHREMKRPISKYSTYPYTRRFGTWRKALEAFIEFINSSNDVNHETDFIESEEIRLEPVQENEIIYKHKTKRIPSERLKVQVLMRDGNKCRLCGITLTGDDIHFDHILAWSKGGETVLENLQVLCSAHNLAKGNV